MNSTIGVEPLYILVSCVEAKPSFCRTKGSKDDYKTRNDQHPRSEYNDRLVIGD